VLILGSVCGGVVTNGRLRKCWSELIALWRAAVGGAPHAAAGLCVVSYFGHVPFVFYFRRFAFRVLGSGLEALPHERAKQEECDPKS